MSTFCSSSCEGEAEYKLSWRNQERSREPQIVWLGRREFFVCRALAINEELAVWSNLRAVGCMYSSLTKMQLREIRRRVGGYRQDDGE